MKASALMVAAFVTVASRGASAKVQRSSLVELVRASDVIVLAEVEAIEDYVRAGGRAGRAATARVLQTWHGEPGPQVRFRANKLFGCDTAYAEVGERALLFLGPPRANGVRSIVGWGQGRFPMRRVDDQMFVRAPYGSWDNSYVSYETVGKVVAGMIAAWSPLAVNLGPDHAEEDIDEILATTHERVGHRRCGLSIEPPSSRDLTIGFAAGCVVASLWVARRRRRLVRASRPA